MAWAVLTIAVLIAGTVAANAQTTIQKSSPSATAPAAAPPGWAVDCADGGAGLACKATQSIVMAKTHQLLLSISINKAAADRKSPMLLQLPHGLFLPAGVTVAVDGAPPIKLEIQTCDVSGCYAGSGLESDTIAAISKGSNLNVVFEDLKKQKITVPVPLAGFDAAYKKL